MKTTSSTSYRPALSLPDLQMLSQGYRAADAAALRTAASSGGSRRASVEKLVSVRQELRQRLKQELRERGCPENAVEAAASIIIMESLKTRATASIN